MGQNGRRQPERPRVGGGVAHGCTFASVGWTPRLGLRSMLHRVTSIEGRHIAFNPLFPMAITSRSRDTQAT